MSPGFRTYSYHIIDKQAFMTHFNSADQKQDTAVVVVADDRYAPFVAVVIASLGMHNRRALPDIYLLSGNMSAENRQKLTETAEKAGTRLRFAEVDEKRLEAFESIGEWSKYTFMKLMIPEVLPKHIRKAVYLDADTYVADDIGELLDMDVDGIAVAGVKDLKTSAGHKVRTGIPKESAYLNSGVMVMNMARWREAVDKGLFEAFIATHKGRTTLNDQDVINGVFQNETKALHVRFNMTDFCYCYNKPIIKEHKKQLRRAFRHPVVIHFTCNGKPWIGENFHVFGRAYRKAMAQTPYGILLKERKVKNRKVWLINGLKYYITRVADRFRHGGQGPAGY